MSKKNGELKFIYYSNYCTYCIKLINQIKALKLENKFIFLCIDVRKDGTRIKLIPGIHSLPALIINNRKPLIGIDAFKWVYAQKQFNQITCNTSLNTKINKDEITFNTNPLLAPAINNKLKKKKIGPQGTTDGEMNAISGNFSFVLTSDDNNEKNIKNKVVFLDKKYRPKLEQIKTARNKYTKNKQNKFKQSNIDLYKYRRDEQLKNFTRND